MRLDGTLQQVTHSNTSMAGRGKRDRTRQPGVSSRNRAAGEQANTMARRYARADEVRMRVLVDTICGEETQFRAADVKDCTLSRFRRRILRILATPTALGSVPARGTYSFL